MRRTLWLLLALLALPSPAEAIPAFARKYGTNCTMCHSNYPRLNDFGYRYRRNGYRLPGREAEERTVLESPPPFAARAAAAFDFARYRAVPDQTEVTRFQVGYFDLLAGGLLGEKLGFIAVYVPPIPTGTGLAEQEGSLEMANVVFAQVLDTRWLNVRAGRFEPAFVPFSVKRQLSVSPREAYEAVFAGGAPFAETQAGLEVSGYSWSGFEYYAGWIDGSATDLPRDVPDDLYLRVSQVFGQGEGQTAGQRVGATVWYGRARPQDDPGLGQQDYWRVAADASLNFAQFNLALQGIWWRDAGALWSTTGAIDTWGGFAELTWLPRTDFVAFARAGGVLLSNTVADGDVARWAAGARLYPVNNVALHLEYTHAWRPILVETGKHGAEDFATARVDFAF